MRANVGENIRRIRMQKGISQKELAEKAGITNVLLNNYEHGVRNPKIGAIRKIADVLGVSTEALMSVELTEEEALQRLFGLFRQFDGRMDENDGKIAVRFKKLDLRAFYERYQVYVRERTAAEEERDPEKQAEMKKEAWEGLEAWMDSFRP